MKKLMLLTAVMLAGCADNAPEPDAPTAEPAEAGSGVGAVETPATDAMMVSFTSGDVATLTIPEMHCQLACYPKVKRTLEGVAGVESVALVEQQDDVQIDDRRVTITFAGDVSGADAVAALEGAGYPGSAFE